MPAWLHRLEPYLFVAVFALPALWPFTRPGLPRTNDNLTHYYRTVELDQLVRAGVLAPRWAPDLVHGYGYPVFDFFPYLSHYLVEGLHLIGLNFLTAYKAASMLILLAAGWFAYRLGREHFGEAAGLVAGVAYLYSPYLLYDTYIRGSLPESLALALLPLTMLCLSRAARGHPHAVAWAGVWLAAVVLAHHGVALQTMPFLAVYAWLESARQRPRRQATADRGWQTAGDRRRPAIMPVAGSFILAMLLSAFFWLPALSEARYVQIARGTQSGSMSYLNNFLTLQDLFALPRLPVDPDLLNPPVVRSLPLAALGVAALVLVRHLVAWRRTPTLAHTHTLTYLVIAAITATGLILPVSRPLWDAVPLLQLTLFPWRLLGPISLWVALIAGALFADPSNLLTPRRVDGGRVLRGLRPGIWHFGLGIADLSLALTLCLLLILGLPFASPPFEPVPAEPTLAHVAAFEIPPHFIGTTTVGEYLPIWVQQLPDTFSNRERLTTGDPVVKYEALPSPAGISKTGEASRARIEGLLHTLEGGVGDTFNVASPNALAFVYRVFYFPGWRATLNGQPTTIRVTYPEGLMAVDVPAGDSTLSFQFGPTPPRVLGSALSMIGLLIALWLIMPLRLAAWDRELIHSPAPLPSSRVALLFATAALLALARPLLHDAGRTPLLRRGLSAEGLAGIAHRLNLDFAGELMLLGWDTSTAAIGADDSFTATLYWKASHPLGVSYGFDVRLVDEAGLTWTERDAPRPRDWRFTPGTDFWPHDQYILDPYILTPLAGTPPGVYTLQATVFAYHDLQSIGAQPVGTIIVTSPSRKRGCGPEGADIPQPGVLGLQTAGFSASGSTPGDEVVVSLCWRADSTPAQDVVGELRLLNGAGSLVAAQPFRIGGMYPTSRWDRGEVVRDQIKLRLPAALLSGDYAWEASALGQTVTVGSLQVTAPPRSFAAPSVALPLNAFLGPVTLVGLREDLPPEGVSRGGALTVELVWQANQTPTGAYHVFVHLLNPEGGLIAQSDGVPADWTRPTTGWLPGEFVTDVRHVALPADLAPGTYTLVAGMYTPTGGDRLTTLEFPDGRVPLGAVTIGP